MFSSTLPSWNLLNYSRVCLSRSFLSTTNKHFSISGLFSRNFSSQDFFGGNTIFGSCFLETSTDGWLILEKAARWFSFGLISSGEDFSTIFSIGVSSFETIFSGILAFILAESSFNSAKVFTFINSDFNSSNFEFNSWKFFLISFFFSY